jgi:hypothetical protein
MYQKCTKIKNVAPSTVAMLHKKSSSKKKKVKILCRVPGMALVKEILCRVPGWGALGKEITKNRKKIFAECLTVGTRQRVMAGCKPSVDGVFAESLALPRA